MDRQRSTGVNQVKIKLPVSFWMKIDNWSHHPSPKRLLPVKIRHWTCDRLDLAVGLTKDEL